jgi:hypothetical protein
VRGEKREEEKPGERRAGEEEKPGLAMVLTALVCC